MDSERQAERSSSRRTPPDGNVIMEYSNRIAKLEREIEMLKEALRDLQREYRYHQHGYHSNGYYMKTATPIKD